MTRPHVPQEILDAAHARKAARLAGDWPEADRLRGVIEAAGWRVVDRGVDFALSAAHIPDLVVGDRILYGSSESVPSRLGEASTATATVIVRATDDPTAVERTVAGLLAHSPAETQIVIVADGPSAETSAIVERLESEGDSRLEVVWAGSRLGPAAAINIGLRRANGVIAIVLDPSVEPIGDVVTPLRAALDDRSVALAGIGGMTGGDLRQLTDQASGDVVALDGSCLAMRRSEAAERGPLDERFRVPRLLDTWWSLVLRDAGPDQAPRRAIALNDLPVVRHGSPADGLDPADRERLAKRDGYRLLELVHDRPHLLGTDAEG